MRRRAEKPAACADDNADMLYGVQIGTLMRITGCGESTAKRWKSGGSIPEPARRLIEIMVTGKLDQLGWDGWKIKNGKLFSPNGDGFTPGEVQAIPFRYRQLTAYQTDQRFPRQADFVEERWVPARAIADEKNPA